VSNYIKTVENHYASSDSKREEFWYEQAYEIVDEYSHMDELVSVSIEWIENSLKIKEDYETYSLFAFALGMKGDFNLAGEKAEKAKSLARDEEQTQMANELIEMIENAASGN
jgi:hypothetical protein